MLRTMLKSWKLQIWRHYGPLYHKVGDTSGAGSLSKALTPAQVLSTAWIKLKYSLGDPWLELFFIYVSFNLIRTNNIINILNNSKNGSDKYKMFYTRISQ